jgi:uncharacterized radical SAM superfamily Fe-S cluster-containing enzyme
MLANRGDSELVISETESICPECLKKIHAERIAAEGGVYLRKVCSEHGEFKVVIWRGAAEKYLTWGQNAIKDGGVKKTFTTQEKACPYDCGPCRAHTGGVCVALMEVTYRCDCKCPVCFASSNSRSRHGPGLKTIGSMYETILDSGGPYPLQLSGGEPTSRDDLPKIVAMGRRMGFDNIQINTNGIRLAHDMTYLARLKESGVNIIYLQFDGMTEDVYHVTRGMDLTKIKSQVLKNCSEAGLGVVLVPVLIPRVNDHQMGEMIQFAKSWMPIVRGIHFQPISYFGRFPKPPNDGDRITLPEVLKAIEEQSGGEMSVGDFKPRSSKEAYCSFAGFFILGEDGKLTSTFKQDAKKDSVAPSEAVRRFLKTYWTSPNTNQCACTSEIGLSSSMSRVHDDFFTWVQAHSLTISTMPFQDVWNIDLERLKGCCIHVVTPDRRLVPFCAYYLTSKSGRRLYQ